MPALEEKFRVAVFDEFLDSFAKLPRAQQKKVTRFMRKFRSDPTSSGINYEKIRTFADPNLRTVRIDQAYRAIVLKPERGNVYVLLWVDHHDEAMAWARKKKVVIHPETGTLQVLSAEPARAAEEAVAAATAGATQARDTTEAPEKPEPAATWQFEKYTDEEFASLAVPAELLEEVRAITSEDDLDVLSPALPPEVYEALFFLGEGEPLDAIRQQLGFEKGEKVDVEDFAAALDKKATSRRFAVVTDDEDLAAMLDAPLEKWRIYLHPSQRKIVEANYSGPTRVLGGAGTGKTVVAMHRAKHLATEIFKEETDRILFTTFTANLAADIHQNLSKLCPPHILRRIEVIHLDKWVSDYLRRQGYEYRIAYYPNQPLRDLWEEAAALRPDGFTSEFLRDEWEEVVQPAGCATWEDYKKASRAGRGRRLSRQQRKALWPVFEMYRDLMEARGLRESIDAMRDATTLLQRRGAPTPYRAIVVDEAQDMDTQGFRLLRAQIQPEQPNDLFIVGDGHQRIYRRRVVLKHGGINIVGRSRKLYINYRTTEEIRRFAVALLDGVEVDDLDDGRDENRRFRSLMHGAAPVVKTCASFAEELDAITGFLAGKDPSRTCLVTRTNVRLDQYGSALGERDVETCRLRRSGGDDHGQKGLRLATMHRVKGLEFDHVLIVRPDGGSPSRPPDDARRSRGRGHPDMDFFERTVLYVCVTRARRSAVMLETGTERRTDSIEDS